MTHLPSPPTVSSLREYGERLDDVQFWMPYVRAVLARHGLPEADTEAGFVGTYPTFLVGKIVVKLFGYFRSWQSDHDTELAAHRLLKDRPEIPAPRLLGHGRLYDEPGGWPYLVTQRLTGHAWREASLPPPQRLHIAEQLGAVLRRVHDLPPPATGPLARDWLRDHCIGCADRHRSWGSLPDHLVEQINAYVQEPGLTRRIVHADLTADHVFVQDGRLVGIIDWGDAMVTDPYYELGALHLDPFGADKQVLQAFLTGYGWPVDADFARRAMSAALMHQFDLFVSAHDRLRLDRFHTLDELATALWNTA